VNFNFGEQQVYPQIKTKLVEKKNVELIVNSVQKLAPLGLKVSKAEMLNLLGLSAPADDEEVLEQSSPAAVDFTGLNSQVALNNAAPEPGVLFNAEPGDPKEGEDGFIAISDEIMAVLEKALNKSTDFRSFQKELTKLATDWPPDKIAELLAIATFKARVQGQLEFDR